MLLCIDEAKEAMSTVNGNSSQEIPGKEVQAPPECKDQNENVVETSTAQVENKEVSIERFHEVIVCIQTVP